MNYRKLGGTGLEVAEVGYGAWGIGKSQWIGAEDVVQERVCAGRTWISRR